MDDDRRLQVALQRYAAISPLVEGRVPPGQRTAWATQLAALHHVSRPTIWRWLRRFRQGGGSLEVLKPPAHRADRGVPRRLPPEALEEAIRLRQELPERSTTTLIAMLELRHPEWRGRLARATLDRHLRLRGLSRRQLARPDRPLRRFASPHRNDLWIGDFCSPALRVREGEQTTGAILFALLDHATRFAVGARFVPTRQAVFVEQIVRDAITRYGLPKALFVDNGAELSGSLLSTGCTHLGIRLIHSSVGHPESRGALERFFRTVQASFVPEMAAKASDPPTLAELNRFWFAWLEDFYHLQPHDGLGAHTCPRRAWEADPTPLRRLDPLTVQAAFLLRVHRRVDRTALVRCRGRTYLCPDALVGQRVEVRYHPNRPESVEIWQDGRFLRTAFLYTPPAHVPRVPAPAPRPAPTITLLDLLEEQRQQRLQQALADPLEPLPPPPPRFTEAHAAALLEHALHRNLSERELAWLAEAWRRDGGWDPQLTATALHTYCLQFGTRRHLSFYLDHISQTHLRARQAQAPQQP